MKTQRVLLFVYLLVGLVTVFSLLMPHGNAIPSYGSAQTIATGQGFPVDIAAGSDGTVYWANQHPFGSGAILKLAPRHCKL